MDSLSHELELQELSIAFFSCDVYLFLQILSQKQHDFVKILCLGTRPYQLTRLASRDRRGINRESEKCKCLTYYVCIVSIQDHATIASHNFSTCPQPVCTNLRVSSYIKTFSCNSIPVTGHLENQSEWRILL